jgi:hypothetical protein
LGFRVILVGQPLATNILRRHAGAACRACAIDSPVGHTSRSGPHNGPTPAGKDFDFNGSANFRGGQRVHPYRIERELGIWRRAR